MSTGLLLQGYLHRSLPVSTLASLECLFLALTLVRVIRHIAYSELSCQLCSFFNAGGFEWYVDVPPTLELWARWTQAGCFSGLMHEQGRLGELMVGLRAMDGPEPFMVQGMPGLCGMLRQMPLLYTQHRIHMKYCEYNTLMLLPSISIII